MRRLRRLPLLLALLALAACGGPGKPAVPDGAVAVVGDETIPRAELDTLLRQARRTYDSQGRVFPKAGTQEYETLKGQAMRVLVERAQLEQKADDLGVDVREAEVDARLARLKRDYFGGSEQRYRERLREQGMTEAQVRVAVRDELLSQEVFRAVTGEVAVSTQEAKRYYERHLGEFSTAASRDVRHILVKRKATADRLAARLRAGADFAALARRYSQDPGSRALGGRITVARGETVPPVDRVAFSLATGELSPPVRTQYGWHLVQALSPVRPGRQTPFAQVRESIRQKLLRERRDQAMERWLEQVRRELAGRTAYAEGFEPAADETATDAGG